MMSYQQIWLLWSKIKLWNCSILLSFLPPSLSLMDSCSVNFNPLIYTFISHKRYIKLGVNTPNCFYIFWISAKCNFLSFKYMTFRGNIIKQSYNYGDVDWDYHFHSWHLKKATWNKKCTAVNKIRCIKVICSWWCIRCSQHSLSQWALICIDCAFVCSLWRIFLCINLLHDILLTTMQKVIVPLECICSD